MRDTNVHGFLNKYVLVLLHECQYLCVWVSNACVCVYEYVLILSKHLTLLHLLRQSHGLILASGVIANNCSSTAVWTLGNVNHCHGNLIREPTEPWWLCWVWDYQIRKKCINTNNWTQKYVFTDKTYTLCAGKQIFFFHIPEALGDRGMSQTAVKKLVISMTPCTVGVTCSCLTQLVRS